MPMYRPRSSGQAVIPVKKILAARGAWPRTGLGRSLHLFQQRPAGFSVRCRLDRNQPRRRMAMPGQNDLVAIFRATHQFGQLRLGVGDRDAQWTAPPIVASLDKLGSRLNHNHQITMAARVTAAAKLAASLS